MDIDLVWVYNRKNTMTCNLIVNEVKRNKWKISYRNEDGVTRECVAKNFDEMVYRTVEALVEIGRMPEEK